VAHSTGEEFDASYNRGDPLTFQLGVGQVIQGWDQGVQGMKVGGRRQLLIPAHLAYGERGAKALILVPTNDGTGRGDGERQANLRAALTALKPILEANGITGLVEPLGFEACSLRSKREAVEGIKAIGGDKTFKVTHDTFHHHLAGEPDIFPAMTGLIHISGVEDKTLKVTEMRDAHRVLVGPNDLLGNIEQIRALIAGGYQGPVSFEPFAEELRRLENPARAIGQSMDFIKAQLVSEAA